MRIIQQSAVALSSLGIALCAPAQVLGPDFAASYSIRSLGPIPGVPSAIGGITFKSNDPDVLLVGGAANSTVGAIYAARVTRDGSGQINGFEGPAVKYANAPGIDGGIAYGPGNVILYTTWPDNTVGEIKPGGSGPSKSVKLNALGVANSVGAIAIVPPGFPGAGRLKLTSYNASLWYDTALSPDGSGTFDVSSPSPSIAIASGPEGIVFVEGGNPGFPQPSILVSCYGLGQIVTYQINANGDPITSTLRQFITGLSTAEGGTRDPRTGHYLFSTFSIGNQVIVVSGFSAGANCPGDLNHDALVDDSDFVVFAQAYNLLDCADPAMPAGCPADLNHDQVVDDADFVLFAVAYNKLVCD